MKQTIKQKIIGMRARGKTYKEISIATGINANSAASFLRRNKDSLIANTNTCKFCGRKILSAHHKKFCSDKCKNSWWNLHRSEKGNFYSRISHCAGCGKKINVYGKRNKKYCSHECYIKDRFYSDVPSKAS